MRTLARQTVAHGGIAVTSTESPCACRWPRVGPCRYLARVYSTALGLFRVPALGESVDRKLAIIRDTYAALYGEASSRRAELLEVSVVVLIMLEIVLMLLRH